MAAPRMGHDRSKQMPLDDDEDDPVDKMIKKTGCLEKHYKVQECMAENQDWRKCQEDVQLFRQCMADYHRKQASTTHK